MSINQSIFKAYDIRGIYPGELNEETAYKIGRAFAVYLKEGDKKKIVVGCDARTSSPVLKRSFIEGVANSEFDVLDIGLATVDTVYFASGHFNLPAAMITASHNPKNWNGFKLMKSGVEFFDSKDLKIIIEENENVHSEKEKGRVEKGDIKNDYLKHILSFIDINSIRPMRVAVNTGSGAAGPMLELILEKLPLEIDNDHYQFGCVFDADADRVNFTDENGKEVSPSIIGALMVKHFLKKNPYGKIVYSVVASKIIPDIIGFYNGEAVRERVGHTFIRERLKKIGGIFGIETSGHYFFNKNFYADSGIISFLTLLDILSNEKKSLSTLVKEFSRYVSVPEINFRIEQTEEVIKKVAQNFEGYDIDWLDGLTVRTPDFWLNLRSSNTEPLVRLNIEAKDELVLNRVKNDLVSIIHPFLK